MIGGRPIDANELYKDNQRMKKVIDQLNEDLILLQQ